MVKFADRSSRLQASAIRELFKLMADPQIISLGGGNPASEGFPLEDIQQISTDLLQKQGTALMQYGLTAGWQPLRGAYAEHLLQPKGIRATAENVVITTGSTQGIHLVCDAFLNEGDVVLVEGPTFLGTLNVLRKFGARIVPVEMDENGIIPEDLRQKARQLRPKMLYTIPTFQNPSGRTLPLERRKKVAELAAEFNFIVLEDDPYGELRISGKALPPIKAFDTVGNVVLMNSFSKTIAPGLRVGACCATPEIAAKLELFKQGSDTHTSNLTQAICAEFLQRGLMPAHLRKIMPIYAERLNAMLQGLEQHLPAGCRYTVPEGGLFLWVELPAKVDSSELLQRAIEQKVAFVPGAPFFIDPEMGKNFMRLNFSSSTAEQIAVAVERLGKLI